MPYPFVSAGSAVVRSLIASVSGPRLASTWSDFQDWIEKKAIKKIVESAGLGPGGGLFLGFALDPPSGGGRPSVRRALNASGGQQAVPRVQPSLLYSGGPRVAEGVSWQRLFALVAARITYANGIEGALVSPMWLRDP